MQRADFLFTIGYDGNTAIVDKRARAKYGNLSTEELLEAGLYKAAFCSALYEEDGSVVDRFATAFTDKTQIQVGDALGLKRLFGVFQIPSDVIKVKRV